MFDSNVPRFFREEERPGFEAFLDELPGPYLVLLDEEGSVVGCGGYAQRPGSDAVDLCWGMVHRDRQGEGLGRLLTEKRLEHARAGPGVRTVALETSQHTVRFYGRLGFRATGTEPDGYAPGLDRVTMTMDVG